MPNRVHLEEIDRRSFVLGAAGIAAFGSLLPQFAMAQDAAAIDAIMKKVMSDPRLKMAPEALTAAQAGLEGFRQVGDLEWSRQAQNLVAELSLIP